MGNAADKEYAEATFTPVAIHEGDLNCIDPSCVLKEPIKLKQSGSKWVKEDGTEVVQFESHGFFAKGKSIFVYGQEVGTVAAVTGFTHDTMYIIRDKPAYEGQEQLTEEQLKSMHASKETVGYLFAKIEADRQMTTALATYSVAIGKDEFKPLYTADKLSAVSFLCILKTADGTAVGKGGQPGISFHVKAEFAAGVDVAAVLLTGQASSPGGANSVGALAGAGVI